MTSQLLREGSQPLPQALEKANSVFSGRNTLAYSDWLTHELLQGKLFICYQEDSSFVAAVDASNGYHQVPIEENNKENKMFWTPFGKYRQRNLPTGYAVSQDIFTDQFGKAVDHVIIGNWANEDCLIYGFDQYMIMILGLIINIHLNETFSTSYTN